MSKKPLNIRLKNRDEIAKMRTACRLAAEVLEMIEPYMQPGITTAEIDRLCHDYIVNTQQAIPAPLNYRGFPAATCTSVNHVVCHGIPDQKKLKQGDIINLDITVIKGGYHGDTSRMFAIGEPSIRASRLMQVARMAMFAGIREALPGHTLGDIGYAVQRLAESYHYSIVREYCGHGIGQEFHEDPQVLHYGKPGEGVKIKPGMTFTIEPMVNAGKPGIKLHKDKWTVLTRDRSLSAQWEHTILITDHGNEILTLRQGEQEAPLTL
ncbi:type I methionyl aminopeptidase [Ectothiorhodospiraceae bacterium BW-2]|nr:type I methionyl aminopeptidase [Ectothiorhodospiraceae bacterium BW-2]